MSAHWSSCAVHNEPAYPAGPCDCGGLAPEQIDPPPELVAEVSGMLWEWEGTDELGKESAVRLIRLVLDWPRQE